jgi:hypothetical protein
MLVNPCRFIPTGMGKLQPARLALCEAVRWRRSITEMMELGTIIIVLSRMALIPKQDLLSKKMDLTRIKDE